jgi:hypothetical protein
MSLVGQKNPWGAHLIDGFWLKSLMRYRILCQNPSVSAPEIFLPHEAADSAPLILSRIEVP